MKLVNHKGVISEVDVGLIDKNGMFVMLLDSKAPASYYRFSDESEALTKLYERNKELQAKVDAYEDEGVWKADRGLVPQNVAAKLLGMKGREVLKLVDNGELRHEVFNRKRMIPLSAIEQYQTRVRIFGDEYEYRTLD